MPYAERIPSPIDGFDLPEQLPARVIRPGWEPLLHGYDVHSDVARHYRFAELVLLALTGEAPDERAGRRFETALAFAAPLSVAEAPSHAAVVGRACGARASGLHALAALTLAEQARCLVEEHAPLLGWLSDEQAPLPPGCEAGSPEEAGAVERLRGALRDADAYPERLGAALGLMPALLVTLHAAGLQEVWQLEAALCFARWPICIAEAMAFGRGKLKDYPMRLPDFVCARRVTPEAP